MGDENPKISRLLRANIYDVIHLSKRIRNSWCIPTYLGKGSSSPQLRHNLEYRFRFQAVVRSKRYLFMQGQKTEQSKLCTITIVLYYTTTSV